MVFSAKVCTVFLSSPGDVLEDRRNIVSAINSWNQRNGLSRGLIFLPLTWEDLVAPEIGDGGQDVINKQIGSSYDIFFGVMWSRFGTPTSEADSGTEEEFRRAVDRHNEGHEVSIAFIFKSSDIPQKMLDVDQYSKVIKFKESVSSAGCLYREYSDGVTLVNSVNLILDRFANRLSSDVDQGLKSRKIEYTEDKDPEDLDDGDLGLFDINKILEEEGKNFEQLMSEWTEKIVHVGRVTESATEKLNSLSRFGAPDPQDTKKIVDDLAKEINKVVDWGDDASSKIDECMVRFSKAQTDLVGISIDFSGSKEDLLQSIASSEELVDTVGETNDSLRDLASSVLSTPRVSRYLNKANRRLAKLLEAMIERNSTFSRNIDLNIAELRSRL